MAHASVVLLLVLAVTLVPSVGHADPILNGNFDGGLLGWSTIGNTSVTSGQALIRNSPGGVFSFGPGPIESLLEIAFQSLDDFGTSLLHPTPGEPVTGSAIAQSFTANAGDVLSFNWNYLSDEPQLPLPSGALLYPDFSMLVLDGEIIALGTSALTTQDGSALGFFSQSGTQLFSRLITETGTHSIGFAVFNTFDGDVASAMLIDSVSVAPVRVPAPATGVLLLTGLLGVVVVKGLRSSRKGSVQLKKSPIVSR